MNINWYPGHMKKTKEEIINSLKLVDIVLEVIDARIPNSSRNPLISEITQKKDRIIIMNKTDLSDPNENEKWIKKFADSGIKAIKINSKEKINTRQIYNTARGILEEKFKKNEEKNIENENIRMMVVGVPNSGKSTFINNIAKRKGAKVGNRPGVTQQKQWIKTNEKILLLDTPGVLWPKLEGDSGLHLSFTNAIKDEILNVEELCLKFLEFIKKSYPENLKERYKIDPTSTAIEIYDQIGLKRGAIIRKGEVDYTRCANLIFNDFRSGKLGRITIEKA